MLPERQGPFAVTVKAEFVQVDIITLVICGITGTADEFDGFVDRLQQRIAEAGQAGGGL
jgi:uncharacterized alpha/beta hydrolase family protein